jgi:crossover junction endodeoxyribonuclease RuvC
VKSAVTGNGRADKAQVAQMVRLLLGVRNADWPADATDALAVALCGAQRLRIDRLTAANRSPK